MPMTTELTALERAVLSTLLDGTDPTLIGLRAQSDMARVRARELTGVGFFTDILLPETAVSVDARDGYFDRGTDVAADIEGLEREAGFVLFVKDGFLDTLEGFTYDEPWPDQVSSFRVYRVA